MNHYLWIIIYESLFIRNFLGMIAVRENRYVVLAKDFEKAYKNQLKNKDEMEHEFYH